MAETLAQPIEAFLFDLDGTLIDSMPLHQAAWVTWHARRGLTIDDPAFFSATAGRSNIEILSDMLPGLSAADYEAMQDEKESLYRDLARERLTLIAGAQAYVASAAAAGLKLAVCTASTLPNMALAFERFGIDGWVSAVVSPADRSTDAATRHEAGTAEGALLRGKPHPDIFLEAAHRLGVAPAACVVFEDAPLGVEAARRAGMRAVALTTTLPLAAFGGFPNLIASAPDFSSPALASLIPSLR